MLPVPIQAGWRTSGHRPATVVVITAAEPTHRAPPGSTTASGRYPAHLGDTGLARSSGNTGISCYGWYGRLGHSAVAAASGWGYAPRLRGVQRTELIFPERWCTG